MVAAVPPATVMLPPTPRDFEIHRLSLIEHLSTRRLAEKHDISQTRVRQIVFRVCQWLAAALPVKTEAELEQEKRLAQHLAAAQLQHQVEQLQTLFDATYDPKYLRQQNRSILALARLATIPGAIDSLAADCGAGVPPAGPPDSDLATRVPPGNALPRGSSLADPTHDLQPSTLDPGPWTSSPPPLGDCSPASALHAAADNGPGSVAATTALPTGSCADQLESHPDLLAGLELIEQRLLTLIDNTDTSDIERRKSLEQTLINVRGERVSLVLQISPQIVGAPQTSLTPEPPATAIPLSVTTPTPAS